MGKYPVELHVCIQRPEGLTLDSVAVEASSEVKVSATPNTENANC